MTTMSCIWTDIILKYVNMTFTQRLVRNKIVISSFLNNYYSEYHHAAFV